MPSVLIESNGSHTNGEDLDIRGGNPEARTRCLQPMINSGALDKFTYRDLTPAIGREFEGLQVRELLNADEQLIKDLAVTSQSTPNAQFTTNLPQFPNEVSSFSKIKM